ncbi:RimJ/RimL family protein N-acetyltransferase [Catenulispora sp. MAP12-49]|uniref:GNAT family N-acetyltransferase n=1 Tax=Catenulispora sp. MAP12-49 TaxID=3156302 RepID=UPI00351455B3
METLDRVVEPTEIVAGRYQLRPPSLRDVPDMMELSRDPEVVLWNPLASGADEETARAWAERWADWDGGQSAQFGVYEAVEGRLLGLVSLHKIDLLLSSAELGYRVAPWARGRGVATTAVRTVTEWAFGALELTRVQLIHAVENVASCRVADKCGFLHEGTTRSSYRYGDNKLHDEHIHGRLVGDPAPGR